MGIIVNNTLLMPLVSFATKFLDITSDLELFKADWTVFVYFLHQSANSRYSLIGANSHKRIKSIAKFLKNNKDKKYFVHL